MIQSLPRSKLIVDPDRQRIEIDPQHIADLADSISSTMLLHPPVLRDAPGRPGMMILVAGECRIRAMEFLWARGEGVTVGTQHFSPDTVPFTHLGSLDPVLAFELELEENIRRRDISWQERSAATDKLFKLKLERVAATKPDHEGGFVITVVPNVASLTSDLGRNPDDKNALTTTRQELLLAKHLSDPDIAKAGSLKEAFKILLRKEDMQRSENLGVLVGRTFTSAAHTLKKGDCFELMSQLPSESFDVILTDPPYGMEAQDFGDSGGKAVVEGHFYDDSYRAWQTLACALANESFRLAKPESHAYVFCDFDRFHELKAFMVAAGWRAFRTPLVWHNPTSMRAPWPDQGPQRKYQLCLYAVKGNRKVIQLFPDLVSFPSDPNLNHPAQKPVSLFSNYLSRSIRPGDSVLDPFAGSGTIFPAAHGLKVSATGFELDPVAYGISVKRLEELK